MTMFVTIYGKMVDDRQSYIIYFDARYILLATVILPAAVFRFAERSKITFCFGCTFLFLVLFDPIHNWFGVGYYQRGFSAPSYYYINYIAVTSFFVILFGIIVLKSISEKAEAVLQQVVQDKESINNQLISQNQRLTNLNYEIEAQNEELQQQQEELSASREKLEDANFLISQQKEELAKYNTQLEDLVEEKSQSLASTNRELVKYNNELRQFSYTVSHHMRGPVARLLGLTQLLGNGISNPDELNQISRFVHQSAMDLDTVLRDLNLIIDTRNQLYNIREKVDLQKELEVVRKLLLDQSKDMVRFEIDLKAPFVYAMRPMIQSVLHNLIGNAIKYRSPDRSLSISVRSFSQANDETIIEVQDNGLGLDLATFGTQIFKLYKRFHTHVSGKGLGLFIVKTQVEMMNGRIELKSEINIGSCFRVILPPATQIDKQVFLESDSAQLCFDAELNTTIIHWKRNITSAEYRKVFEAILQTLRTYNSPGWIADLRHQGKIEEADQIWFVTSVLQEAIRAGLKRIVAIGFRDPIRTNYYERMKKKTAELGIEFMVCENLEEAKDIVRSFLTNPHNRSVKADG